jgi:outer membrane protein OmpA-like peptidoglycan-associated protein
LTLKFADLVFAQGKYQEAFDAYKKADSLKMLFDDKRKSNYSHAANILKVKSPYFLKTNYFTSAASWDVNISSYSTNSSNEDMAPFCWNGNLFLTSSRFNVKNKIKLGYDFNELPFLDIYGFAADGSELNLNSILPKSINTDRHDGPIAISKDTTLLIINRNFLDPNKKGVFNLFFEYYVRNKKGWSAARKFYYTNPDYSVQHPYFDDKTKTLYFSSNMFGGFGGFDIYTIQWNGMHWEGLKNLGPEINTNYDEVFPNIDLEGNLIYATNHMETYGGIDLVLYRNGIRYLLPSPINSEYDDFGLTFDNNSDGYFTSNRSNQLFNDQVYKFTLNRSYDAILLAQETVVPVIVDTVAVVPIAAVVPALVDTVAVAPVAIVVPLVVDTVAVVPVAPVVPIVVPIAAVVPAVVDTVAVAPIAIVVPLVVDTVAVVPVAPVVPIVVPVAAVLPVVVDTVAPVAVVVPAVIDTVAIVPVAIVAPVVVDTVAIVPVAAVVPVVVDTVAIVPVAVVVPVVADTIAVAPVVPIVDNVAIVPVAIVVPVVVDTIAVAPVAVVVPVVVDTVAVAPEVVIPVAVVTDTIIPVVQIGNLDPDSSAIVKIENNPKVIENQVDDVFETIVYFEFDKYESILDTNSVLRKIIKYMAAHPNKMVVLNGHTDKYGPYMYNIELSKKRAIILRRYLMAKGVDPIQIKYGIYGESKPLVKQHNRKASAINRRVEVFVLDKN